MTTDTIDAALAMPKQNTGPLTLMTQASHLCTRIAEKIPGTSGRRLYDLSTTYERALRRWQRRMDALPLPALVRTCEQCLVAKPESGFTTFIQALPDSPVICDACLDTLPMDLVMALRKQNASLALPAAPTANTIEDHTPDSFSDPNTSTAAGREDAVSWEIQTPNLRDRLDDALCRARNAISPIDRQEWLIEAQNLCERLVDAQAVCSCGVAYSLLTGRCEACDERHEQLMADRARMGAMALDVDSECGF